MTSAGSTSRSSTNTGIPVACPGRPQVSTGRRPVLRRPAIPLRLHVGTGRGWKGCRIRGPSGDNEGSIRLARPSGTS
jgi:hypothetical protein